LPMETLDPNKLFDDDELQEFVEDVVHSFADLQPDKIAVVAYSAKDELVGCSYHNMEMLDKANAMAHIFLDFLDDYIRNNAPMIRQILVDSEGDDDEDDE